MAKYVICPEVALRLALENAVLPPEHRLLAPTLLRSQLLARLYRLVREGNMTREEAEQHLVPGHMRLDTFGTSDSAMLVGKAESPF